MLDNVHGVRLEILTVNCVKKEIDGIAREWARNMHSDTQWPNLVPHSGVTLARRVPNTSNAFIQVTCVIFAIRGVRPIVHGCHVPKAEGRD